LQLHQPVLLPRLDEVEALLHGGGVVVVEQVGEAAGQQVNDNLARLGGPEPSVFLDHVLAVLDHRHDLGVGAGPSDAFLLQCFDERGFGIAGGRLGELLFGLELLQAQHLTRLHRRQIGIGRVGLHNILVGRLLVNLQETGELRHVAGGLEEAAAGGDLDVGVAEEGRFHLRSHTALPDQCVDLVLVRLQVGAHGGRGAGDVGGPDRLVGILRQVGLGKAPGLLGEVLVAVGVLDVGPDRFQRRRCDAGGIRAHVSDETHAAIAEVDALVEPLGDLHGLGRRKLEAAVGLLLQFAGGERRLRVLLAGGGADRLDDEGARLQFAAERPGFIGGAHDELLAVQLDGLGAERRRQGGLQLGGEHPVFLFLERADLALAVHDESQGDRLDAPRRQPPPDLSPQERADLVADQPIEDAPRVLRLDQVLVNPARRLERLADGVAGDLVEHDPEDLVVGRLDFLENVLADRLALAVGVCREVDHVGLVRGLAQVLDDRFLARDDLVVGLEAVGGIDAEPLLGQILDMAHGREHRVLAAEVPFDGPGLGGGFDYDKGLGFQALPHTPEIILPGKFLDQVVELELQQGGSQFPHG